MVKKSSTSHATKVHVVKKCSYCKKSYEVNQEGFAPFCSSACKQNDLYSWLNEDYRLSLSEHNGEINVEEQQPEN